MKSLIYGLILVLAGSIFCQPETAYGQKDQTSAKSAYPKLVRFTRPNKNAEKNKRKKMKLRRKIDMSKVPQLIRPTN